MFPDALPLTDDGRYTPYFVLGDDDTCPMRTYGRTWVNWLASSNITGTNGGNEHSFTTPIASLYALIGRQGQAFELHVYLKSVRPFS